MTVTVDTGSSGLTSSNGRALVATPNGNLLAVHKGSGTVLEFWFSANNGSSFTRHAAADLTLTGLQEYSLFVDAAGFVHLAYGYASGILGYRRGTLNGAQTEVTWSSEAQPDLATSNMNRASVVAAAHGTGWKVHIAYEKFDGTTTTVRYTRLGITSGGALSTEGSTTIDTMVGSFPAHPVISFAHTGDGRTAQANPHVMITWDSNVVVSGFGDGSQRFVKIAYPDWTVGTVRRLVDGTGGGGKLVTGCFDGTRTLHFYGASTSIIGFERDLADTTTTSRNPTALSDGDIRNLSVTYDNDRNIYLFASGATSGNLKWIKFNRAAGTWGSWAAVTTPAVDQESMTAKAAEFFHSIDVLWESSGTVRFDRTVALNSPPTAPTWVTVGGTYNVAAALVLDWTFNDPDTPYGDTPSAYALKRTIGATTRWWDGTDWDATSETWVTTTATTATIPSSWGADGDASHSYFVAQKDAAGVGAPGVYSSALVIVPDAKVNPVATGPSGTITTAMGTATWTSTDQSEFKVDVLADPGGTVLWSSGWIVESGTRAHPIGYTFANSTDYEMRITTKTAEGLENDPDTVAFSTSFTVPDQPDVTLDLDAVPGAVEVTITNPVEGGEDVVHNDIFVRVASGLHDGNRSTVARRIATEIDPDGGLVDWAVGSGIDYEYMARAWAANGTYTDSEWVG